MALSWSKLVSFQTVLKFLQSTHMDVSGLFELFSTVQQLSSVLLSEVQPGWTAFYCPLQDWSGWHAGPPDHQWRPPMHLPGLWEGEDPWATSQVCVGGCVCAHHITPAMLASLDWPVIAAQLLSHLSLWGLWFGRFSYCLNPDATGNHLWRFTLRPKWVVPKKRWSLLIIKLYIAKHFSVKAPDWFTSERASSEQSISI